MFPPSQPFVLADAYTMIVPAIIVGVFSLAVICLIGLWMVKDR